MGFFADPVGSTSDTVSHVGKVIASSPAAVAVISAVGAYFGVPPMVTAGLLGANTIGQGGSVGDAVKTGLSSYAMGSAAGSIGSALSEGASSIAEEGIGGAIDSAAGNASDWVQNEAGDWVQNKAVDMAENKAIGALENKALGALQGGAQPVARAQSVAGGGEPTTDGGGFLGKAGDFLSSAAGGILDAAGNYIANNGNNVLGAGINAAGTGAALAAAREAGSVQSDAALKAAGVLGPAYQAAGEQQAVAQETGAKTLAGAQTQGAYTLSDAYKTAANEYATATTQAAKDSAAARMQTAQQMAQAYGAGADAQVAGLNAARGDIDSTLSEQRGLQSPFLHAGDEALGELQAGFKEGGRFSQPFTMADAQNSDAEKWAQAKAQDAMQNQQAKFGGLGGTQAIYDTGQLGANIASQFQGQAFDQWLKSKNLTIQGLQNLVQTGQISAGQLSSALSAAGMAKSQIDQAIGQVKSGGVVNSAGALATGTNQAADLLGAGARDAADVTGRYGIAGGQALSTGLTDAAGTTAAGGINAANARTGGNLSGAQAQAGGIVGSGNALAQSGVNQANILSGGLTSIGNILTTPTGQRSTSAPGISLPSPNIGQFTMGDGGQKFDTMGPPTQGNTDIGAMPATTDIGDMQSFGQIPMSDGGFGDWP